ncbi:hypothetical protein [Blastococcus sp. KM273129]|uniref:hypothetical protein n=1 Tax=Blastococcus sp. KM273129 TaxID=2570315 RepID=UPI001F2D6B64|nr:hypothetical protein [Blastococcus sp. KM273129]
MGGRPAVAAAAAGWTSACAHADAGLRDLQTAARQWSCSGSGRARETLARACRRLADDVDAQTADEEATLLPLLDAHLPDAGWAAITRTARCGLSGLGLALEDCGAADRVRLLGGLPAGTRLAWRLRGGRRYRAAVVRLRGAPPAA